MIAKKMGLERGVGVIFRSPTATVSTRNRTSMPDRPYRCRVCLAYLTAEEQGLAEQGLLCRHPLEKAQCRTERVQWL